MIERVRPIRVMPRFLYFAVENGWLSQDDYNRFFERWQEYEMPTESLPGGVFDINPDVLLTMSEKDLSRLRLGKLIPARVIIAARRITDNLGS